MVEKARVEGNLLSMKQSSKFRGKINIFNDQQGGGGVVGRQKSTTKITAEFNASITNPNSKLQALLSWL